MICEFVIASSGSRLMLVVKEADGQELLLEDAPLGSGGEATVHAVTGQAEMVAKLYRKPTIEHAAKLAAMIAAPPLDLTAKKHVSIAWPTSRLLAPGPDRRFLGYLMPRVHDTRLLYEIYNPRTRLQAAPTFHFAHLLRVARNLAAAVKALHDRGYVIGDVNESNILVNRVALVTLIDTDSFQVQSPEQVYRCRVGKPEYTPPELQRSRFADVDRGPEHDAFGLAVLIFQLLMQGTHPFTGVYTGPGEPGAIPRWIESGYFPYADDPALPVKPRPHAPPWKVLPPVVQELMVFCFQVGHTQPGVRPTAADWRTALDLAEAELTACSANPQHHYPRAVTDGCPWCAMALLQGRDPFPTVQELRVRAAKPEGEAVLAQPAVASPSERLPEGIVVNPPAALPLRASPTVRRSDRRTDTAKRPYPVAAPTGQGPPAAVPLPAAVPVPAAPPLAVAPAAVDRIRAARRPRGESSWWHWLLGGGLAMLVVMAGVLIVFVIIRSGARRPGPPVIAATTPDPVPPADRFAWQPKELVAVLGEHRGRGWSYARSVVYTPDGKLFSAGSNGDVYQWAPATLELLKVLPGPGRETRALAVSPDGSLLAVAGSFDSRTVVLLDPISGTSSTLKGEESGGNSVAFSPDGKTLAIAGGPSKKVNLWDVEKRKFLLSLGGNSGPVNGVAFSADGNTLAWSCEALLGKAEVKVWDVAKGRDKQVSISMISGGRGFVALAFTPNGKSLATISGRTEVDSLTVLTGRLNLWDVSGGIDIPKDFPATGRALAFSPDGSLLAWEHNREVVLLDMARPTAVARRIPVPNVPENARFALAFSPDSKTLAVGAGPSLHLYDPATGKDRVALQGHGDRLLAVVVLADNQSVLTGSADGMVRLWDFTTQKERSAQSKRRSDIVVAARVGAGGEVLYGYRDGEVRRWDPRTGEELSLLTAGSGRPLAVSANGQRIVLAPTPDDGDKPVRVQDFVSAEKWDDTFARREVTCAAFRADGATLAMGYLIVNPGSREVEPRLRLWSVGQPDRILEPVAELGAKVTSVALSPDGQLLAAGGVNGGVRLWNPANFQQRASIKGHNGAVGALTFSPDSKRFVTADDSGLVVLWDAATFDKLREWKLPGGVFCTAFSDDGQYLVLGNGNGTAYVLRLSGS